MDVAEFRRAGKRMVDYVADYLENIGQRRVVPAIEPGYLRARLPAAPPRAPEPFDQVLRDVEQHIMPGVSMFWCTTNASTTNQQLTHWQHPRFHAYFPAGNSFPSILADILSDSLGVVGFSWVRSLNLYLTKLHATN